MNHPKHSEQMRQEMNVKMDCSVVGEKKYSTNAQISRTILMESTKCIYEDLPELLE